jgi:hypothetical protein
MTEVNRNDTVRPDGEGLPERGAELQPERAAFTVEAFCLSHSISRAHLYELWKDGLGPRRMTGIGRKVLISVESARAWRARMETEGDTVRVRPMGDHERHITAGVAPSSRISAAGKSGERGRMTIPTAAELEAWIETLPSGHASMEMLPLVIVGYLRLLKVAEAARQYTTTDPDGYWASVRHAELRKALDALEAPVPETEGE